MTYVFLETALCCFANYLRAGRTFVVVALVALSTLFMPATHTLAATSIANTVHNLTPTGPGTFRAPEATGLCVYCHTPHNASPQRGLWNRELSGATYQLYESTTLKALVKQPTGSSRLCLSCHDGTLAMGTLRRAQNGLQPTLGVLTGRTVLGTNLSGDHPISFVYDSALAANRGELADPMSLPAVVKLDHNRELQCTSCHDAHEDRRPNFLRMDTRNGALCLSCHTPTGWSGSTHATSLATWNQAGSSPWPASAFPTVSDNACENCHRPHAAGHGSALLAQRNEVANCTICHSGTVAARNIQNEFIKPSHHPIENAEWTHTPKEDATLMPRHVTCADCHNAHQSNASAASAPNVSGRLQGTRGINQGGAAVTSASFEHEVCYKCHGMSSATTSGIQRVDNARNARLQFDPANPSYHPVAAIGKNASIQNLMPGYTASSRIGCSSCHNNDAWTSGGMSPAGVHGSLFQPILEREYRTEETVIESPQNYALCYKCHDRAALTSDVPGKFPHARHLDKHTPCAACHDAHGSRQYPHLINFMLFDRMGIPVVTRSSVQKRLEYIPQGSGGQCYLNCHGWNHEPSTYP
jgi:predicted CXXCH cytochrome family protein